jgi:hypothetical protein
MPDGLVGKDHREARAQLVDKMKLTIAVQEQESLEPAGLVIFAEPRPKTLLGYQTGPPGRQETTQTERVVLVVSTGVEREPEAALRAAGAETLAGLSDSLLSTFGELPAQGLKMALDKWSPLGMSGLQKQDFMKLFDAAGEVKVVAPEPRQQETAAARGLAAGVASAAEGQGAFTLEVANLSDLADRLYPFLYTRISRDLKVGRQRIGRAMDKFS